jgi:Aldehyde dehydrogenase family
MDARPSPWQATIVKPDQAQPITPFGLEMNVLLSTEATGGAISVLMAWHKPGEGPPDPVHFTQEEWRTMTSLQLLMNGEPVRSARTRDVMRPTTGNTLATCSRASLEDLNEAVAAARAAFAGWSSTPISGPRVARHWLLLRR